nr:MAG TPA: hypothetical protein [Caudoviricetes sp.]DAU06242.1 MAG TPA: hypothetical protein [Caudoviricetes sp.]
MSDLTVLAANIFSDSVLFRASRNDYSSLTGATDILLYLSA